MSGWLKRQLGRLVERLRAAEVAWGVLHGDPEYTALWDAGRRPVGRTAWTP